MMEIYSAIGLILLGLISASDAVEITGMLAVQARPFWVVTLTTLGFLQYISMVLGRETETLRVILSLVAGPLWMWLSLSTHGFVDPSDIAAWMLGIGNVYAFVINATLIKRTWN